MEIGVSRAPPESGSRNTSHMRGRCKFENRGELSIAANNSIFSDVCLVGAAGFEPTTCSTQNCRATRLRYTPFILGSDVDTRLSPGQQGVPPPDGPYRPLNSGCATRSPGCDTVFLRRAGDHLQHALGGPAGGNDLVDSGSVFSAIRRMRPSARMKIMSSDMIGVLHPHRHLLLRREIEQHALAVGQFLAGTSVRWSSPLRSSPSRPRRRGHPILVDDLERLECCRPRGLACEPAEQHDQ